LALKNRSDISTITGPEFVNLEPLDLNPLMSKCQVKVFHLGKNRNGSYIDRPVADKMAKTLRGAPIVAAYNSDKEDFGDHGHVMHIEDGEVTFSCKTVPYGFISPDAEVWYQNYIDYDEFGNQMEHTYMCTTGYLWTGQFEELTKIIKEGQPQSMELDESSLSGRWAEDTSTGYEFFIINDATFSKLCVLGDDVEPCMRGASVEAYTLDSNNFRTTLFSMMQELKDALKYNEGGSDMQEHEIVETDEQAPVDFSEGSSEVIEEPAVEEYAKEDEEKDPEPEEGKEEEKEEPKEEDEDKKKYELLQSEHAELQEKYSALAADHEKLTSAFTALQSDYETLKEYKVKIENEQKDALINKYHMLSEETRNEIMSHKTEFSYNEIEAKLALAYVHENLDFDQVDGKAEEDVHEDPIVTFSLEEEVDTSVSPVLQLLRDSRNK
jgi:hypothetical protein